MAVNPLVHVLFTPYTKSSQESLFPIPHYNESLSNPSYTTNILKIDAIGKGLRTYSLWAPTYYNYAQYSLISIIRTALAQRKYEVIISTLSIILKEMRSFPRIIFDTLITILQIVDYEEKQQQQQQQHNATNTNNTVTTNSTSSSSTVIDTTLPPPSTNISSTTSSTTASTLLLRLFRFVIETEMGIAGTIPIFGANLYWKSMQVSSIPVHHNLPNNNEKEGIINGNRKRKQLSSLFHQPGGGEIGYYIYTIEQLLSSQQQQQTLINQQEEEEDNNEFTQFLRSGLSWTIKTTEPANNNTKKHKQNNDTSDSGSNSDSSYSSESSTSTTSSSSSTSSNNLVNNKKLDIPSLSTSKPRKKKKVLPRVLQKERSIRESSTLLTLTHQQLAYQREYEFLIQWLEYLLQNQAYRFCYTTIMELLTVQRYTQDYSLYSLGCISGWFTYLKEGGFSTSYTNFLNYSKQYQQTNHDSNSEDDTSSTISSTSTSSSTSASSSSSSSTTTATSSSSSSSGSSRALSTSSSSLNKSSQDNSSTISESSSSSVIPITLHPLDPIGNGDMYLLRECYKHGYTGYELLLLYGKRIVNIQDILYNELYQRHNQIIHHQQTTTPISSRANITKEIYESVGFLSSKYTNLPKHFNVPMPTNSSSSTAVSTIYSSLSTNQIETILQQLNIYYTLLQSNSSLIIILADILKERIARDDHNLTGFDSDNDEHDNDDDQPFSMTRKQPRKTISSTPVKITKRSSSKMSKKSTTSKNNENNLDTLDNDDIIPLSHHQLHTRYIKWQNKIQSIMKNYLIIFNIQRHNNNSIMMVNNHNHQQQSIRSQYVPYPITPDHALLFDYAKYYGISLDM